MTDQDCVQFLKWSLPQLRMRWNGFRRVRAQVCKRVDRHLHSLGLTDASSYRSYLEGNRSEWEVLDSLCRIAISRFYRDREVFRSLEQNVLVKLCEDAISRGDSEVRCWSIGCASGEEPYTVAIMWNLSTGRRFPSLKLSVLATDSDSEMIERAMEGGYAWNSLRNLPIDWIKTSFIREGERFRIRADVRDKVTFLEQDLRAAEPLGLFHFILCRNLAFTYFEKELQVEVLARLHNKLYVKGALITGVHEDLPSGTAWFEPWPGCPHIYRKMPLAADRMN